MPGEGREGGDRRTTGGRVGTRQLAAQLGHQARQGQRPGDVGERARGRQGVDDVEEGRGLLVLAAHRRDDQPLAGPGDGHEEQPGLVVAHLGASRARVAGATGDHVDEVGGTQQRAAQPQVGPDALLHAGHDDEVPLETGGCRGRQQGDRLARRGPCDERVAGDVLAEHVVEEVGGRGAGQPVDEPGGGVEQAQHGVEVAVGAATARTATERRVAPRTGEPAGAPHPPEHHLDALALAQGVDGGSEHPVHPAGRRRLGPDAAEREGLEHRLGEEHVAGPAPAVVELEPPQRAAQPAQLHGIRPTDRRGEHVDDVGGVELLGPRHDVEGAAQQGEERTHRASSRTGRSAVAVSTGTPAPRSTRRRVAVRAPPRTTTAIRDHGTPSSRWAARSRPAT